MKSLFFTIGFFMLGLSAYLQVPQGINYQAVARSSSGTPIVNQPIGLKISLLDGANGPVIYSETHAPTTNIYGLFTSIVGQGTPLTGNFTSIAWDNLNVFMRIEIDETGGTNYAVIGQDTRLWSVPYALHAASAETAVNDNDAQTLQLNGSDLSISNGNQVDLSGIDTDTDAQTLSLNGTNLSISNGNLVNLVAINTDNQNLSYSNDSIRISNGTGVSLVNRFWKIGGNSGLTNSQSVIGTLDSIHFTIKVDNENRMVFYSNGRVEYSHNNTTAPGCTYLGYNIGTYNGAAENVGMGRLVLTNQQPNSSRNVAIGHQAMYRTITSRNVGIGAFALNDSAGGDGNVGIGYAALSALRQGGDNTAIGDRALNDHVRGNYNVGIGAYALNTDSSGAGNTAVGYMAMRYNKTGTNNVSIGYQAGPSNLTTGLTNSVCIGYNVTAVSSNVVRIGNSSMTSIGGYAAWTNLSDVRFKTGIDYNYALGLDFINKLQPATYYLDVKKLDEFLGVENADAEAAAKKSTMLQQGFMAQDIEKICTEMGVEFPGLYKPENENDHYSISYSDFVMPLVKAMQELYLIVQQQQAEINALQSAH